MDPNGRVVKATEGRKKLRKATMMSAQRTNQQYRFEKPITTKGDAHASGDTPSCAQ